MIVLHCTVAFIRLLLLCTCWFAILILLVWNVTSFEVSQLLSVEYVVLVLLSHMSICISHCIFKAWGLIFVALHHDPQPLYPCIHAADDSVWSKSIISWYSHIVQNNWETSKLIILAVNVMHLLFVTNNIFIKHSSTPFIWRCDYSLQMGNLKPYHVTELGKV